MGDWKKECTKNILRSFPGEDLKKYRVYCNLHNFRHLYLSLLLLFLCKKLWLWVTSEENFVNCLDLTSALLICSVRTAGWHFIIRIITVSCLLIPWFIIHHGAGHVVLRAGLILTFTWHFHDNDNLQPVKVGEASVSGGYCDRRSGNKVRLILLFKCHTVGVLLFKSISCFHQWYEQRKYMTFDFPLLWSNWFLDQVKCSAESALEIEISSDQRRDVRNMYRLFKVWFQEIELGRK